MPIASRVLRCGPCPVESRGRPRARRTRSRSVIAVIVCSGSTRGRARSIAPLGITEASVRTVCRRLRLAAADQGPQRLVEVHVRRLDDRDVGVPLAQQTGGHRDAGGATADDDDLVLRSCHIVDSSCRSGVLAGFFPGAVAAEDVADIGEAVAPQQACRHRGPVTTGAVHDGRLGGIEFAQPGRQLAHRDRDRIREWCRPRPRPDCARRRPADRPARRRARSKAWAVSREAICTSSRWSNITSNGRSR